MKKIFLIAAFAFALAGCKKDKDDETPVAPKPEASHISATVDGVPVSFTAGKDGYKAVPFRYDLLSPNRSMFACSLVTEDSSVIDSYLIIGLGHLYFTGSKPDKGHFNNFFAPGKRTYSGPGSEDGAFISYYDHGESHLFSSEYLAQPTGSYFKILNRSARAKGGKNYVDVKGEFKCEVFSVIGSGSRSCSGKFSCTFVDQP